MIITIKHNHGHLKLQHAHVEERQEAVYGYTMRSACGYGPTGQFKTARYAVGTVVSGGETSRLFHATATRKYDVGAHKEWPLYGRELRECAPGEFEVDCTFCG